MPISISFCAVPRSDIYIEGDEKQLSQVFLNLLKNSMQSLEGKTDGQIEVTLEVTDKLYIKLLDNGRGIPMELQEKTIRSFLYYKNQKGRESGLVCAGRL